MPTRVKAEKSAERTNRMNSIFYIIGVVVVVAVILGYVGLY
jgi:cytochrome c-type biogenesis protein CcmH/NrfG